jgi:fluoride exporter
MIWIGVILAGGVGAVLRFLLDGAVARRAARSFPF